MADKLMDIPNDATQYYPLNYWLKRLNTHFIESTNQNPLKIRKRYNKTLGTYVINSALSFLSLHQNAY